MEHLFNIVLYLIDILPLNLYVLKNFWLAVYMYYFHGTFSGIIHWM